MMAEVIWLRWLFEILSDSTCAISIARDPVRYKLTKHIGLDASFVRACVQDEIIALPTCLPKLADYFTNPQTRAQHDFFSQNTMLLIHHEFFFFKMGA